MGFYEAKPAWLQSQIGDNMAALDRLDSSMSDIGSEDWMLSLRVQPWELKDDSNRQGCTVQYTC